MKKKVVLPSIEDRHLALAKVEKLIRHLDNVQNACVYLGKKLIERGEIRLGVKVCRQGHNHDNSKWGGMEWEHIVIVEEFDAEARNAAEHHALVNKHHPESWGDISQMPREYVAEMCCDWYARATEFGTNVWDYFKGKAAKRYGIKPGSKVYKWIKEFFDLLLEKPF